MLDVDGEVGHSVASRLAVGTVVQASGRWTSLATLSSLQQLHLKVPVAHPFKKKERFGHQYVTL